MKMYDAMVLKREIGTSCNLDAKILETLKDGFVLRIMENMVNENSLEAITDFVNKHELNMLFDNGVFILFPIKFLRHPSQFIYPNNVTTFSIRQLDIRPG